MELQVVITIVVIVSLLIGIPIGLRRARRVREEGMVIPVRGCATVIVIAVIVAGGWMVFKGRQPFGTGTDSVAKWDKSEYDRIKTGMTLAEVEGILGPGKPGIDDSEITKAVKPSWSPVGDKLLTWPRRGPKGDPTIIIQFGPDERVKRTGLAIKTGYKKYTYSANLIMDDK